MIKRRILVYDFCLISMTVLVAILIKVKKNTIPEEHGTIKFVHKLNLSPMCLKILHLETYIFTRNGVGSLTRQSPRNFEVFLKVIPSSVLHPKSYAFRQLL